MANKRISQLTAKAANLAATDLLEVSEVSGLTYVSKNITGQEIIDGVLSNSTLQSVTDAGNTTTNDIDFGAGVGILLDNSSRLREGTIDAGTGGTKGIAQICGVGYELKWEAGSQYVMNGSGDAIRVVNYKFNTAPTVNDDDTKGFYVGSRWILDDGTVYTCLDSNSGVAVWALEPPSTVYSYEMHVSQVDGNDTTGDGSVLNPVATITKALTLLTGSRKTIIIHPGVYSENVTVANTNITIRTSELTGANTLLSGTLTIGTLGSGTRISGLKMSSLVISGTAQAYISNCTVDTQVTKSSSGYVEIINSEMQCTLGIQISGSNITIINGNKNVAVSVSNASAQVIIKGCNSVVTPSASAGNLAIVDCIVTALGGNGITITGVSTTLTLLNSQVLVTSGNNVAPISVAGIYTIINTIYDKPSSTLTGTSTNSIDYFQFINVDQITASGNLVLNPVGSIDCNGKTIDMTGGEIHKVPLIHSQNNVDLTIEAKGTADLVFKTNNVNRLKITDTGGFTGLPEVIQLAASDETTALTAGTGKVTFRMPYAMTVTAVRASLTTAQTSGSIFTVDINEGGTSILSTKLTIDNTEKTSVTAATPPVISDTALADDAEMTIDIDQIGDGTAKGLKVTIIGTRV